MKFSELVSLVGRISPALSLLINRVVHPRIHVGILVELPSDGHFSVGSGVHIGALSRIYLGPEGCVSLGDQVSIGRDVHLQTSHGCIDIGNGSSIQDACRLYGNIIVGRGCLFGPNIYASSGAHAFDAIPHLPINFQEVITSVIGLPIIVEDDCWVGINAVLMPGITIGKGSVVGAGSVVLRDVPPYSVVAGAPAKFIRKRFDYSPPAFIDATCDRDWPYFYSGFDAEELQDQTRDGYTVNGWFTLALKAQSATRLRLAVKGLSSNTTFHFADQIASVECGVSELVFDLPAGFDTAKTLLRVEGRARLCNASLY